MLTQDFLKIVNSRASLIIRSKHWKEEFRLHVATLDITPTIDTVPVSPSLKCERKAASLLPLEEASKEYMS